MLENESEEILRLLKSGGDAVAEATAGVDDELAKRRPQAGGWSILECVEHLAVTERALLSQVSSATESDRPHENPAREAKIRSRALDRSLHIEAPEVVVPQGRFATLSQAIAEFEGVRAETIQFVVEFKGDSRSWLTTHPLVYTQVNCYEMLLMMALHPARHAKQIMDIRAGLSAHDPQG